MPYLGTIVARRGLTVIVMLAALLWGAPSPVAAELADVKSHWSRPYVVPLAARGIVQGYPDGNFHPERPVTRAEFVRMMVLALDRPVPAAVLAQLPPVFPDVDPRHWSRAYVEAAWERGWLPVEAGQEFGGEQFITRAEVAVIAARAGGLEDTGSSPVRFTDADALPQWAARAAAAVVAEGWMTGYPDGSFRPDGVLSRAEAAAVTARLLSSRGALYDAAGYLTANPAGIGDEVELTLRLDGGEEASLRLPADLAAWRNGRSVPVSQLRFLDEVALITSGPGPVYVEAWHSSEQGRLVTVVPSLGRMTYLDARGERRSRAITDGAPVARNGRPAALDQLEPNDLLYLVLARDGAVRAVDAVQSDVRGRIWAADQTWARLYIGVDSGAARWYASAEDVVVFIDGRRATIGDLRLGDRLLAALDSLGRLQYVEAYRREATPR